MMVAAPGCSHLACAMLLADARTECKSQEGAGQAVFVSTMSTIPANPSYPRVLLRPV